MRTPKPFPVGTRVVAYRNNQSPCRCRVIATATGIRTLREIQNKNTLAGVAARVKYREGKVAFPLPINQISLESPPETDGLAFTD